MQHPKDHVVSGSKEVDSREIIIDLKEKMDRQVYEILLRVDDITLWENVEKNVIIQHYLVKKAI